MMTKARDILESVEVKVASVDERVDALCREYLETIDEDDADTAVRSLRAMTEEKKGSEP